MAADDPAVPFPEGSRGDGVFPFPEGSRGDGVFPFPEGSRSDRLEGSPDSGRGFETVAAQPLNPRATPDRGFETVAAQPLNPRATPAEPRSLLVDDYWDGDWRGPTLLWLSDSRIETAAPASLATRADRRMNGAVFPGIADAHVHLGLIDPTELFSRGVSWVRDLGGDPNLVAGWSAEDDSAWPAIEFAGSYLTCPGGYPSDRGWAPAASIRLVSGPEQAVDCVTEQVALGATVIKVMLNSDAGPTPNLATVRAIVEAAHAAGVAVIAHAQGEGEPEKALAAGVSELAHTPWSTELDDDVIEAMAGRMTWVSTLDIHGWGEYGDDFGRATANARRFLAAGGTLTYGTDLGNGSLPVGVNERELRALAGVGLDADGLALSSFASYAVERPMVIPGRRPREAREFARWLVGAGPLADWRAD